MAGIQRTYRVFLALCLFGVIILLPEAFFTCGNLYMQFPLYRLLEERALQEEERQDQETLSEITGRNVEYAKELVEKEEEEKNRETDEKTDLAIEAVMPQVRTEPELSAAQLSNQDFLMSHYFIVDENTSISSVQLNGMEFLKKDLSLEKNGDVPQILIYHTHAQEGFADSREGEIEDTIVGVGDYLTDILENTYGYQVIHVRDSFDLVDDIMDRSKAYDYARDSVEKILKDHPSVEVVIDLHRDGIPEERHLVTSINGKETAQLLLFNGLSYTNAQGKLDYLPNPNLEENLAFSFQLEYGSRLYYPGLYRGIYLAGYRYNLHLKERALLLEAGAQTNTIQEVKNAMEPFAALLDLVLSGKGYGLLASQ